jgi:hypothetical protein
MSNYRLLMASVPWSKCRQSSRRVKENHEKLRSIICRGFNWVLIEARIIPARQHCQHNSSYILITFIKSVISFVSLSC